MNVVFVVNQALWKDTAEWNAFHSYLITRDGADPIPSIVTVIRLMGENARDPLTNGKDWNLTGNNWKINLLEMFTFKETWILFSFVGIDYWQDTSCQNTGHAGQTVSLFLIKLISTCVEIFFKCMCLQFGVGSSHFPFCQHLTSGKDGIPARAALPSADGYSD